jgi:hypothetical protein
VFNHYYFGRTALDAAEKLSVERTTTVFVYYDYVPDRFVVELEKRIETDGYLYAIYMNGVRTFYKGLPE